MSVADTSAGTLQKESVYPSELGVWLFVLGDLFVFGFFFGVFASERNYAMGLYNESQALLNQDYGALNTVILLSSSYFVALAVHAARHKHKQGVSRFMLLTILCGLAFIAIKYFEYNEKFVADVTITSNDFFMYYFAFTGLHLVHVVIGLCLIFVLWRASQRRELSGIFIKNLEGGAIYWHMVDLLWLIIFPLFYLLG